MMQKSEAPTASGAERASGTASTTSDIPTNGLTKENSSRTASALYLAIMAEIERRRIALGFPMEPLSEFAGLADRSYPKYLAPWAVAGRQANWQTLQIIADTLYPDGFELKIKACKGPKLDALRLKFALSFDRALANPVHRRELLAEWGTRGGRQHSPERMRKLGRKGARARSRNLSPEMRSELARRAALARHGRARNDDA
jgi:hypothetical protein